MPAHIKCHWCGQYGADQIRDPVAYKNHKGVRISKEPFCSLRCIEEYQERYIIHWIDPPFLQPKKKKGCFIATSACGHEDHPMVQDLRAFRDNWLIRQHWGPSFINWYYNKGPALAAHIEKSATLKNASRWLFIKPLHKLVTRLRLHRFQP